MEETKEIEQLLTVEDVAKLFRVSTRTIFAWIENGKMPMPFKITGGRNLWPRKEISEWIASNQNKTS